MTVPTFGFGATAAPPRAPSSRGRASRRRSALPMPSRSGRSHKKTRDIHRWIPRGVRLTFTKPGPSSRNVTGFLPSGLYRRHRNLTGSVPRAWSSRAITAGRELRATARSPRPENHCCCVNEFQLIERSSSLKPWADARKSGGRAALFRFCRFVAPGRPGYTCTVTSVTIMPAARPASIPLTLSSNTWQWAGSTPRSSAHRRKVSG